MALREIRTGNDPVLRKICKPVDIVDDKIKELLCDLAETMYHTPNGGGLAAPQVGILKRLAVIDVGEGLYQLINPIIVKTEGIQLVTEGCLSFPGIWCKVKRPKKVTVQALNEKGQRIEINAVGVLAKAFCHEIDHLDGIVLTDRAQSYFK